MKNNLIHLSRKLRSNLTDAEQKLWYHVRQRQIDNHKFRRQHIIGKYIVDFICIEQMLIIELDGGQHTREMDEMRTDFLNSKGYQILRFWNNDVLSNISGVLEIIKQNLSDADRTPS